MRSLLNRFFAWFTFKHPLQPTVLILLIIFALTYQFGFNIKYFLVGLGLWSLVEYLLHRFIFHAIHFKEPYKSMATELHMLHHKDVTVDKFTIAPFFVTLFLSGIIFLVLLFFIKKVALTTQVLTGIYLGYAIYEWVHYWTHNLKFNFFGKKHHLYHHFKNPKSNFGVTSPIWDYLFGTKKG